jgi:hypothetical protein
MMEQLSSLASTIVKEVTKKLSFNFFIFFGLFLYGLTFIPDDILKKLNFFELINPHKNILAGSGILSIVLLIGKIGELLIICYKKHEENKKVYKPLHNLTPEEKYYLLPYIRDKKNTLYRLVVDGVMSGLTHKNITYLSIKPVSAEGAYNLNPWAREYLEKQPHLLDGAAEIKKSFASMYPRNRN